jgi:biotin carboxylase
LVPVSKSKRILFLSATTGYQLRSFNDAAEQLGVEILFATDRCQMLDDPWQDRAIPVRFHDEPGSLRAILGAAEQRPIDGVLAVGDRPVVLAAHVARRLGLAGNPPDAAAASANKRETRARFAAAGLPVPWVVAARAGERLAPGDVVVRYPCVVKPLGLSGSRGVIRADSAEELTAAVDRVGALLARKDVRALRTGLEDELLIEGFIPGREFAVEGLLTRGALRVLAIFDKPDPLDGPFFEETIYVTPSSLRPDTRHEIEKAVGRATTALGLAHGPVHAECRVGVDGVYVLEVAARPIGGLCSRVLMFDGSPRSSLEHVLVRHALGDDVSDVRRESQAAGVMMIPIPNRGMLKRVEGEDEARAVAGVEEVQITAKRDQVLEPLPEAGSYLGFIFARAPESTAVVAALREAHHRLRFVVDPAVEVL